MSLLKQYIRKLTTSRDGFIELLLATSLTSSELVVSGIAATAAGAAVANRISNASLILMTVFFTFICVALDLIKKEKRRKRIVGDNSPLDKQIVVNKEGRRRRRLRQCRRSRL